MAWTKVATVAEIPLGSMKKVVVDEEFVTIYHLGDGFFATSDVCTHKGASLVQGNIEDGVIACPKHGGKFDIRSGAAVAFPCVVPVETYSVEVRGDEVWLED